MCVVTFGRPMDTLMGWKGHSPSPRRDRTGVRRLYRDGDEPEIGKKKLVISHCLRDAEELMEIGLNVSSRQ